MTSGNDNLLVRHCLDADRPQADELTTLAFQTIRHIYRPTPAAVDLKRSRPPSPRLIAVESTSDGRKKILGSVEYELLPDQLSLMALAVHPEFRRHGIARRLIQKLQHIAAAENIPRLTLWTITQTGNVPLFEHLGFQTLRISPADLFESDLYDTLTEAFMELSIQPERAPR